MKKAAFKFTPFSVKQKKVLTWWTSISPYRDCNGIIAEGSIRSGKTLIMSLSFVLWAMSTFQFETFGMAGKTIASFRRNVLFKLKLILRIRGYKVRDVRSDNLIIISKGSMFNYFYIFGGKDESSQDLVQGLTCAGFFFDEVVLMVESFVNQAVARCSVEGAKVWFNGNPGNPKHWFKVNWVDQRRKLGYYHIHFELDDNPSLSEKTKARYRATFTGVFFQRFILGLWVAAEGIIYPLFANNNKDFIIDKVPDEMQLMIVSIGLDFGGNKSAQALQCTGITHGFKNVITLDEAYTKDRLDPEQLNQWVMKFVKRQLEVNKYKITGLWADNAEPVLIRGIRNTLLKNQVPVIVNEAIKGPIIDRIRLFNGLMATHRYKVMKHCNHAIEAFSEALWDEKKMDDVRLDDGTTDIDTLDAVEYSVEPWQKTLIDIMMLSNEKAN